MTVNSLAFQKFKEADFEKYYSLVSNEQVMAQITERSIPLDEAKVNYGKLLLRNERDAIFGSYQFYLSETEEFIGLGHLTVKDELKTEAEIGYMLLPQYWGKGYGSKIATILIEMAKERNIHILKAIIDPTNTASRRILIHQGFVSEKVCEIDGLPGEILSLMI